MKYLPVHFHLDRRLDKPGRWVVRAVAVAAVEGRDPIAGDHAGPVADQAVVRAAVHVLDHDLVAHQLKRRGVVRVQPVQQQRHRSLGAFEGKALVLQVLDLVEHPPLLLLAQALQPELLALDRNVVLAAQLADHDPLLVAHQGRIDVLVAALDLDHGIDVSAALMRKGRPADVGHMRGQLQVGQLRDVVRHLGQMRQLLVGHGVDAHLELEVGDDAVEVAVAAALAVAVDRALHVGRSRSDRLQRVCTPTSPSLWVWMPSTPR